MKNVISRVAEFFRWVVWFVFNQRTPIVVINDCRDENARGRMMARLTSLLPKSNITFIGVSNDLEAAICLVDTLDAIENRKAIILVNVAPRNGNAKKFPNGTPFGEFFVGKVKVFSTIDGCTLNLVQEILEYKLNVKVYDIPKVVSYLGIGHEVEYRTINSQFRSFDFLPRLVSVRVKGKKLPYTVFEIEKKFPETIAFCDIFGNLKTSILFKYQFTSGQLLKLVKTGDTIVTQEVRFYLRLKDVPDNGKLAVIIGSSGFGESRFLELVVQGHSAANLLGNPPIGVKVVIE